MALYLGSEQVIINLGGMAYCLNIPTTSTTNGYRLLSSDNYILQDSESVYLIPNDTVSSSTNNSVLLSSDGYVLKDIEETYLIFN